MSISPQIHRADPGLDPQQLEVVGHQEGPLLVRAGPGAGKTRVLIWRLINLLLRDVCAPEEMVLLAFGHLAAAEMRRRFEATARAVGYRGDVDRVRIATIHSLSHRVLREHHHRVGLRSAHDVLTREAQRAFMSEHFDAIFGLASAISPSTAGRTRTRSSPTRPGALTASPRSASLPGGWSIPATRFTS